MIVRFCPGYSYFWKCNRRCGECPDIVVEDMNPEIANMLNNYPEGCRPPVRGYGRAENIKITKTTPTDAGAVEENFTSQEVSL